MAKRLSTFAAQQVPCCAQVGPQVMRLPPVHAGHSGSRIDHVVTPSDQFRNTCCCAGNTASTDSDHFPLECCVQLPIGARSALPGAGTALLRRHWVASSRNEYCQSLSSAASAAKLQAAERAAGDGSVGAAFNIFPQGIGLATNACGMPAKRSTGRRTSSHSKPFFDLECQQLKRRVRTAAGHISASNLSGSIIPLVRSKSRAYKLGHLRTVMTEQYLQPRQFWKQLTSADTLLPVCLQPVQLETCSCNSLQT